MQVHEAAAVVESGGDAGAEWRPSTQPVIERPWRTRDRVPRCQGWDMGYSLSKSIYDLRTSTRALIRVRRASLGPQGRVPPGVHGEAR